MNLSQQEKEALQKSKFLRVCREFEGMPPIKEPKYICSDGYGRFIAWDSGKEASKEAWQEKTKKAYPTGGGFKCPICKTGDYVEGYLITKIDAEKIDNVWFWVIELGTQTIGEYLIEMFAAKNPSIDISIVFREPVGYVACEAGKNCVQDNFEHGYRCAGCLMPEDKKAQRKHLKNQKKNDTHINTLSDRQK